jgi:hypothetical protein
LEQASQVKPFRKRYTSEEIKIRKVVAEAVDEDVVEVEALIETINRGTNGKMCLRLAVREEGCHRDFHRSQ